MPSENTKTLGYKALPFLIRYAQKRQTVTYSELGEFLGVNPHTVLPHVLGFIRDQICDPQGYPRINAIVISKNTKQPGHGFLPEGVGGLTEDEIRNKYEQFRDAAFTFPGWDDLLSRLGLEPLPATYEDLDKEAEEYNQLMERTGGRSGGEQEAHRLLKQFIAAQPHKIGLSALKKPVLEYKLLSGDRCDILLELFDNRAAVIEIKVGQRGELVKGIYQLIKYGALVKAERGHGDAYPVELYLVAYSIPADICEFAKKFGIHSYAIPEKQVI